MREGLTEDLVAQIHKPESERELPPREGLVVRWAEKAAADFRSIDEPFKAELREHFSEPEIVELGMMIGQYLAFGRLLVLLGGDKLACEIYTHEM